MTNPSPEMIKQAEELAVKIDCEIASFVEPQKHHAVILIATALQRARNEALEEAANSIWVIENAGMPLSIQLRISDRILALKDVPNE